MNKKDIQIVADKERETSCILSGTHDGYFEQLFRNRVDKMLSFEVMGNLPVQA